jgi:beta-1,4-galactosyltransferase 1
MKVGIVIPYRNRLKNINIIIPKIKKNLLDFGHNEYEIIVANQADEEKFNKGFVMNAGADIAINKLGCEYLIFHDTDADPMNTEIDLYGPKPNSGCLTRWYAGFGEQKKDSEGIFGGAVHINKDDFLKINGWSNCFWGWGCEDIEIIPRFKNHDIKTVRGEIRFADLVHSNHVNPRRGRNSNYNNNYKLLLLSKGNDLDYSKEGFGQILYEVSDTAIMFDDTHIKIYDIVNVNGPQYTLGEDMPPSFLRKIIKESKWKKWKIIPSENN